MADFNNDGHMDLGVNMYDYDRSSGDITNQMYIQYYHPEKGWTTATKNIRTDDSLRYFECGDLDDDNDLDFLFVNKDGKLGYYINELTEWKRYIIDGVPDNIRRYQIIDIDMDGDNDVIFTTSFYDPYQPLKSANNTLWIAYNEGLHNWSVVKQTSWLSGQAGYFDFVDIDRDGDMDIVISCFTYFNYHTFWGGLYVSYNELVDIPDISFTEKILSPHVRSGSVHQIKWTAKDAHRYLNGTNIFNISVSYNGQNGTYHDLMQVENRWWTNMFIPDVPSQNVYFKLEWRGSECISGPYVIHNSEDRTLLMDVDRPEMGFLVHGGEKTSIVLNSSKYYTDTSVTVWVRTDNVTYPLGVHSIGSEEIVSFDWIVPDMVHEENCTILFRYEWRGEKLEHESGKRFSMIPTSMVPGSIVPNDIIIPLNVSSNFEVNVLSRTGLDITAYCRINCSFDPDVLTVYDEGGGSFSVISRSLGEYTINITATRYERSASVISDVIVHRDIFGLRLEGATSHRTGDVILLELSAVDHYGKAVDISEDTVIIDVTGSGSFMSYEHPMIQIICDKPGWVDVNVSLLAPHISLNVKRSYLVSSYFAEISMNSPERVFIGDMITLDVTVKRYDMAELYDAEITWTLTGPASILDERDGSVDILSTGPGAISITADIRYMDEIVSKRNEMISIAPPSYFELINRPDHIEVGTEFMLSHMVMDSLDEEYVMEYDFSVSSTDESVFIAEKENVVFLIAIGSGEAELVMTGSSFGRTFESVFNISVVQIPRSLSVSEFELIRKGETKRIEIEVYDILGEGISDYEMIIDSTGVDHELVPERIEVTGTEIVPGSINITISGYGYFLSHRFDFEVIPWADRIGVERDKVTLYQRDPVEVNISLIDRDGDPIPDAVLSFDTDERLSLSYSQGSLTLLSEVPGGYAVSISCSYYGSDFEKSIDVDVLERTVMTDVILDRIEGEKYRIIALDQHGNDISSLCTIEIEGDHNRMDHSSFEALSGKATVHVSYNGTTISREIVVDVVTNGEIPLAMILLVSGSILVLLIAGILLVAWRRGSSSSLSEE